LEYAKSKYNIEINSAGIGAAGVISKNSDFAKLTNIKWNVDLNELTQKTSLQSASIINDFQAIGYGINLLDIHNENDIFVVRGDKKESKETKVIVGAGTGLGKSILVYDERFKAYLPIPSEGGHSDFPAQNDFETKLTNFIKNLRGISQPITYEELLSGRGLTAIYLFLRDEQQFEPTTFTDEIDSTDDKTPLISQYKTIDETCKEAFRLFTRFYARCAKNFVLDTMSTGGLYIAGGIAAKNKEIFTTRDFLDEFENTYRRSDVLKEIPIYIILNYDVSLYGACFAAMYNIENV
jgi:glucokinase